MLSSSQKCIRFGLFSLTLIYGDITQPTRKDNADRQLQFVRVSRLGIGQKNDSDEQNKKSLMFVLEKKAYFCCCRELETKWLSTAVEVYVIAHVCLHHVYCFACACSH